MPNQRERDWFDGKGLGYTAQHRCDGGQELRERQRTLCRFIIRAPPEYEPSFFKRCLFG